MTPYWQLLKTMYGDQEGEALQTPLIDQEDLMPPLKAGKLGTALIGATRLKKQMKKGGGPAIDAIWSALSDRVKDTSKYFPSGATEANPVHMDRFAKRVAAETPRKFDRETAANLVNVAAMREKRFWQSTPGKNRDLMIHKLAMENNLNPKPQEDIDEALRLLQGLKKPPEDPTSLFRDQRNPIDAAMDEVSRRQKIVDDPANPRILHEYPPLVDTPAPPGEPKPLPRGWYYADETDGGGDVWRYLRDPEGNMRGSFSFGKARNNETMQRANNLWHPYDSAVQMSEDIGKGLGTRVYHDFEKDYGVKLIPTQAQSPHARNLWLRKGFGRHFGVPLSEGQPYEFTSGRGAGEKLRTLDEKLGKQLQAPKDAKALQLKAAKVELESLKSAYLQLDPNSKEAKTIFYKINSLIEAWDGMI